MSNDYFQEFEGQRVVYEVKYDGWKIRITKDACLSRKPMELGFIPCVGKIQAHLLKGDEVEAELIATHLDSRGIVCDGSGFDVPGKLKKGGNRYELRVVPFRYVTRRGKAVTAWSHSRRLLNDYAEYWETEISTVWSFGGPTFYPGSLAKYCRINGWEGFMIKSLEAGKSEALSPACWKFKLETTGDYIVTGTKDGEGKYLGMVGSLEVSKIVTEPPWDYTVEDEGETYHLRAVAFAGGMTDKERQEMTENREDLVLEVCEVKSQGTGGKRRLRHPRFLGWRKDKEWKTIS